MKVVFSHKQAEAGTIYSFYFKPDRPLRYTAGQFTELTIQHEQPDDRGVRRWFTLSSSPTDTLLRITTRIEKTKRSTFKSALYNLEPGTEVQMADPMGDFVLPKIIQTPLIFVAGGIGITPFHSILSWLTEVNETRPIKLLYAVRTEDEIIFQDTFKKAGIHATIVVSQPSSAWGGERGRLSAELITGIEQPTEDTLIYVSGPEPLVESLESDFKKVGLRANQFVGDFFPGYTDL